MHYNPKIVLSTVLNEALFQSYLEVWIDDTKILLLKREKRLSNMSIESSLLGKFVSKKLEYLKDEYLKLKTIPLKLGY